MKFTFNTGRQYQPKGHQFAGQVIEVELVEGFGNVIYFRDLSRGLDGAFYCVHIGLSQVAIETIVMNTYDHNRHQSIDYFEYLQRQGAIDYQRNQGDQA
jgi:hypothetical protein